ncbi:hypothetical protein [Flexivirga alba]|uniref:hypothetical protein n=1 Tax=Flexivirga alba TaxID=702742 RepID=UPI0036D2B586
MELGIGDGEAFVVGDAAEYVGDTPARDELAADPVVLATLLPEDCPGLALVGGSAMALPATSTPSAANSATTPAPRLRSSAHVTRPRIKATTATRRAKNPAMINAPLMPLLATPMAATANSPPQPHHQATP